MPRHETSKSERAAHETVYPKGIVAKIFGPTDRTVLPWIKQDKVSAFNASGGHYWMTESGIEELKDEKGGDLGAVGS